MKLNDALRAAVSELTTDLAALLAAAEHPLPIEVVAAAVTRTRDYVAEIQMDFGKYITEQRRRQAR